MSNNAKGRIISAVVLVLVLGVFFHLRTLQQAQMGREGFLAYQAKRYDRHYAKPDPFSSVLFPSIVLFGGLFLTYELTSIGITKILNNFSPEHTTDRPPTISN